MIDEKKLIDNLNNIKTSMYLFMKTKHKILDADTMEYFLNKLIKYIEEFKDE